MYHNIKSVISILTNSGPRTLFKKIHKYNKYKQDRAKYKFIKNISRRKFLESLDRDDLRRGISNPILTVNSSDITNIRGSKHSDGIFDKVTGNYYSEGRLVTVIEDVNIYYPTGITTVGGEIVSDYSKSSSHIFTCQLDERINNKGVIKTARPFITSHRPKKNIDKGFHMVQHWLGYHEWVLEFLPKLQAYFQYCKETGENIPILIHEDAPRWAKDWLLLLGIPSEKIIPLRSDLSVNNLIFTQHRHRYTKDFEISPSDLLWMKNIARKRADIDSDKTYSKRIFISREDTETRQITNREEVIDCLQNFGFEKVVCSELSVREQINTFKNSNYIVGPHGAGLTNTLFAESGTQLIELFREKDIRPHFYLLTEETGLGYSYQICEPRPGNNMRINIGDLEKRIVEIIE